MNKKALLVGSLFILGVTPFTGVLSVTGNYEVHASESKYVTQTRTFERRRFWGGGHNDLESYPVTAPEYIWYDIGGYKGNLKMSSWYATESEFVVTYSGTVLKGDYAELRIEMPEEEK